MTTDLLHDPRTSPTVPVCRVAVVGGGANAEHDVSLASAAAVRAALTPSHDVVELTVARDGSWWSGGDALTFAQAVGLVAACDVLLPAVHGPRGEDGTLAALADLAGVACVGSGVRAGAVGMDKWVTKLVAAAVGVAVADGRLVRGVAEACADPRLPAVVKPVSSGSSHGVRRVDTVEDLADAVAAALELDDRVLVEEVVTGREIDVAVLRRADGTTLVSPALEIGHAGAVFDTATKYDGSARFVVPAPLEPADAEALAAAALSVVDALGCDGVARADFFLTARGPVLNEVNTMPGMTAHSQVPVMLAAAGLTYAELVAELVAQARARHAARAS
ncbi:D-alanine/D-alanine ligase [Cellulomonas flavigena DSM 20109]|uniref:D-alanine--D-alanine ligase n=1 Tax=Cellulomonas flavigena (strain ATCC 482 / DSM 20109 / BCRC 11376 / JCM 18109 / NBRC 3775 / NCIMB 8073 / NRS 134) TaxID=446466 RepID=D5UIE5_CELFN|nr:D-alanine--D-alanine ligase [Cellulomonas flavigena]ADG73444.1 D-alanine/D-alanine ligase [Cellulomonas flavigena DSM 20109]